MQPSPAAVTAWRKILSLTSPAANTPGFGGDRAVRAGDEIALPVHLQQALEDIRIGAVADGDEHAVHRALGHGVRLHLAQPRAGYARRRTPAQHLVQHRVPDHLDLLVAEQALLQNLLCPQAVAPMDHRHLAGVVGEVKRLLDGRVAAADHQHLAFAEEEAVAGGTGRDAEAQEALLARQAEPLRLRPGRDDDRVGRIDRAAVALADHRAGVEIAFDDHVEISLRADMPGLGLHLLHQPRALDHVGEARIVLDIGSDRELPARRHALHQAGAERGARGIDRSRVAGRAGAEDQGPVVAGVGHVVITLLSDCRAGAAGLLM